MINLTKVVLIGYSLASFPSRDIDYSLLEDKLPKYLPKEVVEDAKRYVGDGGPFLYDNKAIVRDGNSLRVINYKKRLNNLKP